LYSGPWPGFSSKGAKNQKGGYIFKILDWMYAATRGPNVKWEGTDFKWGGRAPLAPPLATALYNLYLELRTLLTINF